VHIWIGRERQRRKKTRGGGRGEGAGGSIDHIRIAAHTHA
jgi:hypothetical protein